MKRRADHRADIDGLRAIAILLVVLYHVGVPGLVGGYLGVDVFFVISGYLITGNLLTEAGETGSVRLRLFWAKRVRRLVPALALVTTVVLLVSLGFLSPFDWRSAAAEGSSSVVYASNVVFAVRSADYFDEQLTSSLFLHTWSLSVEEQFYLVWPLLLLALARLVRSKRPSERRFRTIVIVALSLCTVGSFLLATFLSRRSSPWAFYSLPTRAWEFGCAGVLAAVLAGRRRAADGHHRGHHRVAVLLALAGLGALVWSAVRIDGFAKHPGPVTLIPVGGTIALLAAGAIAPTNGFAKALSMRPARWIGGVSYSWYLWHWPAIIVAAALTTDSIVVRGVGAAVSLGLAGLSLRFVENPVRYARPLVGSARRTFLTGLAVTTAVLTIAAGVHVAADRRLGEPFYRGLAETAELASFDDNAAAEGRCRNERSPSGIPYCVSGPTTSTSALVLLVGDSHGYTWRDALQETGDALGIRVIDRTEGGCPSLDLLVILGNQRQRPSEACTIARRQTSALIEELHPAAVIIGNAYYLGSILGPDGTKSDSLDAQLDLWRDAFLSQLQSLTAKGVRVGVVLDGPRPLVNPIECIARRGAPEPCAPTKVAALEQVSRTRTVELEVVAGMPGVETFDVVPVVCPDEHCRLSIDGTYVFMDNNHLSPRFTKTQGPSLQPFLRTLTR